LQLAVQSGTEDAIMLEAAINSLESEGLIERFHDRYYRLTPDGWQVQTGNVPSQDREEQFLEETVRQFRDANADKMQGRVRASAVFRACGWTAQAHPYDFFIIADRLRRQDLVRVVSETSGDMFLEPRPAALERFPQ
jgi:hypothetical protein